MFSPVKNDPTCPHEPFPQTFILMTTSHSVHFAAKSPPNQASLLSLQTPTAQNPSASTSQALISPPTNSSDPWRSLPASPSPTSPPRPRANNLLLLLLASTLASCGFDYRTPSRSGSISRQPRLACEELGNVGLGFRVLFLFVI